MLLARGKCISSPFPAAEIDELRRSLGEILRESGYSAGATRAGDAPQEFRVPLLQQLLEALRDPDSYYCEWSARGVWLGAEDRPLPRTLAVFDRKVRWRLNYPEDGDCSEWRPNYGSAVENADKVEAQF